MKRGLLIFALLFFVVPLVSALEVPKSIGFVNDFADVIDSDYKDKLNFLVNAIKDNTTVEIAVVTVQNLNGADPQEYALTIGREWGVGAIDNGLVVLVAIDDRKCRIETGRRIEALVTDIHAFRICKDIMSPYFKNSRFGEGIYRGLLEIQGLIKDDPYVVQKYSKKSSFVYDYMGLFFFFYIIIIAVLFGYTSSLNDKRGKKIFLTRKAKIIRFFGCIIAWLSAYWFALGLVFLVTFLIIFFTMTFSTAYKGKYGGGYYGGRSFGGGFGGSGSSGGFSGGGGFGGGGGGSSW